MSWWLFVGIGLLACLCVVVLAVVLPGDREIVAEKIVKHKQEQLHKARADSLKATQEKLHLAQIDSLRTLNTGDIFLNRGAISIVVWNNSRDGRFDIKDVGPQALSGNDWNYVLLWHYQPNFWIARWNTPEWHRLMANAWKPEQPNR